MNWSKDSILDLVATDIEIAHMMRHSYQPVVLTDSKGYFVMLNEAWKTVTGFELDELTAKPFKYFLHYDDYMATMKTYYESYMFNKQADSVSGFENRYKTTEEGKYAKFRWLEIGRSNKGFSLSIAEFLGYEFE